MDFLPSVAEIVENIGKSGITIDNFLDNVSIDLIRIAPISNRTLTLISTWMVSLVVARFEQFLVWLPHEWWGIRAYLNSDYG